MSKEVEQSLKELKEKILNLKKSSSNISEMDTRQGLINPLFRAMGWDFGDFESVKSECKFGNYKDPADYAFFSQKDKETPLLILEAKAFGSDLNNPKYIKQLCTYLGEAGTQWGVLSNGSRYVMYNSKAGGSYESWRFMTLSIEDMDTDDGLPTQELAEKFVGLLSRGCLENKDIQKTYKEHMVDYQIENAMASLMSEPFDTLAKAIKKEFKEERVGTVEDIKIPVKRIISYLEDIADEEGKIQIDMSSGTLEDDDTVIASVAHNKEGKDDSESNVKKKKRVSIADLISSGLVAEGDSWKLVSKGEVFWGRVTGNGEIEVDGTSYGTPSKAACIVVQKVSPEARSRNGWSKWQYKNESGEWTEICHLRDTYSTRMRENN